jgi:DNA-binding transcriptional MerR regulator
MSAQPARAGFGIGEVLAQLQGEFPDVSVSKIRFLESEGLIQPARSPSNYRRFGPADVARLRFILTAQRDEYLPLRVIKDRLAAADGDAEADPDSPGRRAARRPLSRRELLEAAGIDESYLAELEDFGLVRASGRQYGPDALAAARIIVALGRYGVQARHLRAVRAAVERETALIEQVVAPTLRQRSPGSRDRAGQTAQEVAALSLRLHASLMGSALAEAGLDVAGLDEAGLDVAGLGVAGLDVAGRAIGQLAGPERPDNRYGENGFAGPATARSGA